MQFGSRRSTVIARNGMVAASQPLAATAGLRILMEGGNAIDAAVATAAALNVVEPASTGVGGDVFALVWMADEKRVHALNASGRAPSAASLQELTARGLAAVPATSPYAVTVPGAVSGWQTILERYGTLPLPEVLKPAIDYARNGYPVSEIVSSQWAASSHRLRALPSGQELLPGGRAPVRGEIVRLPELASTLQTIAEGGAAAFYEGPLAQRIARFIQEQGGWLSAEDLAGHTPTWEDPIHTDYRGVDCWQCPPNSQGINVLLILNILEGFDVKAMGFQSADVYHHLIECVRLAFADGLYHITDPSEMTVAIEELVSKTYAEKRRVRVHQDRALSTVPSGLPMHGGDTVYIASVDSQGNGCSLINSVFSGFGTGLVVPGTGIALQSRGASFSLDAGHPNALAPGKRPFHTLIPGMATRDGELWLCYGVMGTTQQAQGHAQVLVNMIDFGLSPQEALDAPRFSVRPGEGTAIEDLVPATVVRELESRGHDVRVRPPQNIMFGGGQIIERDPATGVLMGGSEPRQDGCAAGW